MNPSNRAPASDERNSEIIGQSAATQALRTQIARVAPFKSNVLVTGPSGSGKELVARRVHALSARNEERFIPVDCASLTGELMASQLLGHVEGAFTGANHSALGCFRAADRGTIFLDEVGELELPLQAKLLRTLQERVVTPVGSYEGVPIDVRLIAATNRDLRAEVSAGRFREDLYYRLNVVAIQTTPLQERCEDIPELASCFLSQMADDGMPCCNLSPGAEEALQHTDWPGNVRQLKNFLEQAVIAAEQELLTLPFVQKLLGQSSESGAPAGVAESGDSDVQANDLEAQVNQRSQAPAPRPQSGDKWATLATVERDYVLYTLEHTYYNQSAAARLLGISRQSLIRLMKKMDIQAPQTPGLAHRKGK